MNVNELSTLIAKKEGHKSQTRIGDIREILSIIADLSYQTPDAVNTIVKLGISRAKRAKKAPKPQQPA